MDLTTGWVWHGTGRDKIGLAEALNKLGLTYCDIGYDLRAMDYFEQSLVRGGGIGLGFGRSGAVLLRLVLLVDREDSAT